MVRPLRLEPGDLAKVLPPGGRTFVSSCSAESDLLIGEVAGAGEALGAMDFSGIFVPGLNRATWNAGADSTVTTFFQTPELAAAGARSRFLPLCYQDITAWFSARSPDAALLMLSPPDKDGICSFGIDAGFGGDLWREARTVVAHLNPSMPRTSGHPGVPFERLAGYFEADQPLRTMSAAKADDVTDRIAANVARWIEDGSTLQTGLGKLPDAVLDKLRDRRRLKLHTGLAGDGALHLLRSGAMADGASAVVGCAIGSEALYADADDPHFDFQPVSVTHDLARLSSISRLVTINSAMSVDLYGQAYAEASSRGFQSGPGGASDFARGSRAGEGGLRIIALPSAASGKSRIVAPGAGSGPVSLSRFDIDIVATEHGAADLRGKTYNERADALIAIAAPEHRDDLGRSWAKIGLPN